MRSRVGCRRDCSPGTSRPKTLLSRAIDGRWEQRRHPPLGPGPSHPTPLHAATAGEDSGSVRSKQGNPKKLKKGPREHVPLGEGSGEGDNAEEPWETFSASSAASSLASPTFEERLKFGRIMEDVLGAEKEEELPGLLTKHVGFLLSVDVTRLTNDLISLEPTMDRIQTLRNAYDFIVAFLEGMVESTMALQKKNRELLREIIEVAKIGPVEFERKMADLQDRFTYEFVKYLDAEVERLEKKVDRKKDGPGGGDEVLNVVKIVRTRVCAQVDLTMGEDVAILTRMLSYDDRYMMKATLRAVFRDKSPEAIKAFGRLVSKTLNDVRERGADVDPLLKYKLSDMAE
ncbi:unnamed protein product, partial [Ascophyllum nodosum]